MLGSFLEPLVATLSSMQLHNARAQTLPVEPPGTRSVRAQQWPEVWPDALASRVLYRGTFVRAESRHAARNARALVTAVLADWRMLPLLDDVVLCASELVGNAVQHADRPVVGSVEDRRISVGVRCWAWSALFLEIGDYDRRMPELAECPDAMTLGGRGLLIVDKLADRLWWERAAHGGKVVYARFGLGRYSLSERALTG